MRCDEIELEEIEADRVEMSVGVSRTKGGVLLLHGKGGSGRSFRDRVASNKSSLGRQLGLFKGDWDVFSPDGPVELGTGHGFGWWSFPEGVNRSYLADEWIGSQDALDLATLKGQNCQLMLGFSQGEEYSYIRNSAFSYIYFVN